MNELPDDVVNAINRFLPIPDVFSLSRTCRRMYALADCGELFRSMEWSIERNIQKTLTGKRRDTGERLVFIFYGERDEGRFLYYVGKRIKRDAGIEDAKIATLGLNDAEDLHFSRRDGTHVVHRNYALQTEYRYDVAKQKTTFSQRNEKLTYRVGGIEPTVDWTWFAWIDFSKLSDAVVPPDLEGFWWGAAVRFKTFAYSYADVRDLMPYKRTTRTGDKETTTYADNSKVKTEYFLRYYDAHVVRESSLVIVCRDGTLRKMSIETYRSPPDNDDFSVKDEFDTLYSEGSEVKELTLVHRYDGEVLVVRRRDDAATVKVLCNDQSEQLTFPIRTTDARFDTDPPDRKVPSPTVSEVK